MFKTIVIFDWVGNKNIQFTVLDGDHSYLNNHYVNDDDCERADNTIANIEDADMLDSFPYDTIKEVMDNGGEYIVVACGFVL